MRGEKRPPASENALSQILNKARLGRGMTVRGLARASGVSLARVAELLAGHPIRQRPRPATLVALANALGLNPDDVHFAAEAAMRSEEVRTYRVPTDDGPLTIRVTLPPGAPDPTPAEVDRYTELFREAITPREESNQV